jgi:hypothetical protein
MKQFQTMELLPSEYYGVVAGEAELVVVSVVVVLVVDSGDAAGLAAGLTVSVFCSQAASSAAPAKMQMYFFIFLGRGCDTRLNDNTEQERFSAAKIRFKTVGCKEFHALRPRPDRSISHHEC